VRETQRLKSAFFARGLCNELAVPLEKIRKKEKKLFKAALKVSFLWEALVEYTYELKSYLREDEDESTRVQFERDLERTIQTYNEVRKKCQLFLPMIREGLETLKALPGQERQAGLAAVNERA